MINENVGIIRFLIFEAHLLRMKLTNGIVQGVFSPIVFSHKVTFQSSIKLPLRHTYWIKSQIEWEVVWEGKEEC